MTSLAATQLACALYNMSYDAAPNAATGRCLRALADTVEAAPHSRVAAMAATQAQGLLLANNLTNDSTNAAFRAFTEDYGVEARMLNANDLVGFRGGLYSVSRERGGQVLVLTPVRSGYSLPFEDAGKKFLVVA